MDRGERRRLVVVVAVGVLKAECLLAAGLIAVLEGAVVREVVVMVAGTEYEGVPRHPRIGRVGGITHVDRQHAIVADGGGESQQAAPSGCADGPLNDLARCRIEIAVEDRFLVRELVLDHSEFSASGIHDAANPILVCDRSVVINTLEVHLRADTSDARLQRVSTALLWKLSDMA